MVSAAGRETDGHQRLVLNTVLMLKHSSVQVCVSVCVRVTFCVRAGLCEGLAVCEHGYPHHRHPEDAAVLTRLILDRRGHTQF